MTFTKWGKRITLSIDDQEIYKRVRQNREFYEFHMLDHIHSLNLNGIFLDIGANFGNHSVFFEKFCGADVIAFEPVERNLELLRLNRHKNKCSFKIIPKAVGDSSGKGSFTFGGVGRWSQCRVVPGNDFDIVTLDSLEDLKTGRVGLIKADVEGFEEKVILGALEIIKRDLPEIFLEFWNNGDRDSVLDILSPFGYKILERYNDAPTYHFSTKPLPVTWVE